MRIRCMQEYLLKTYSRKNVLFKKGDGIWLYSDSGDKFLDCASGIAVNILGHCNKKLVKVLTEQANNFEIISNSHKKLNGELQTKLTAAEKKIKDFEENYIKIDGKK